MPAYPSAPDASVPGLGNERAQGSELSASGLTRREMRDRERAFLYGDESAAPSQSGDFVTPHEPAAPGASQSSATESYAALLNSLALPVPDAAPPVSVETFIAAQHPAEEPAPLAAPETAASYAAPTQAVADSMLGSRRARREAAFDAEAAPVSLNAPTAVVVPVVPIVPGVAPVAVVAPAEVEAAPAPAPVTPTLAPAFTAPLSRRAARAAAAAQAQQADERQGATDGSASHPMAATLPIEPLAVQPIQPAARQTSPGYVPPIPVLSNPVLTNPVLTAPQQPSEASAPLLAPLQPADTVQLATPLTEPVPVLIDGPALAAIPDLMPTPAAAFEQSPATETLSFGGTSVSGVPTSADESADLSDSSYVALPPAPRRAASGAKVPFTPAVVLQPAAAAPKVSLSRRIATKASVFAAMGFVALMAVSTSVPADALLTREGIKAAALAAELPKFDEPGQTMSASGVESITVLPDDFASATVAETAAASGIRMEATYVNNPNGTVQWPFLVGVHVGDRFGYRDCAGCSSDHGGQDFNPGDGAQIQAIADGVVSVAVDGEGSLGVHMMIDHVIDGQTVTSVYAHMQHGTMQFTTGDVVKVGQYIGNTGNTGQSTGPHLHFEIRVGGVGGKKVDPLDWLYANTN